MSNILFSLQSFLYYFYVVVSWADSLHVCWNSLKIDHNSHKKKCPPLSSRKSLGGKQKLWYLWGKRHKHAGLALMFSALCIGRYFAYLLCSSLCTSNLVELNFASCFYWNQPLALFCFDVYKQRQLSDRTPVSGVRLTNSCVALDVGRRRRIPTWTTSTNTPVWSKIMEFLSYLSGISTGGAQAEWAWKREKERHVGQNIFPKLNNSV